MKFGLFLTLLFGISGARLRSKLDGIPLQDSIDIVDRTHSPDVRNMLNTVNGFNRFEQVLSALDADHSTFIVPSALQGTPLISLRHLAVVDYISIFNQLFNLLDRSAAHKIANLNVNPTNWILNDPKDIKKGLTLLSTEGSFIIDAEYNNPHTKVPHDKAIYSRKHFGYVNEELKNAIANGGSADMSKSDAYALGAMFYDLCNMDEGGARFYKDSVSEKGLHAWGACEKSSYIKKLTTYLVQGKLLLNHPPSRTLKATIEAEGNFIDDSTNFKRREHYAVVQQLITDALAEVEMVDKINPSPVNQSFGKSSQDLKKDNQLLHETSPHEDNRSLHETSPHEDNRSLHKASPKSTGTKSKDVNDASEVTTGRQIS